jgi:hypothetical protein
MPVGSKELVDGEWYFGVKCAFCKEMIPINHDPGRRQGKIRFRSQNPGRAIIRSKCPNGHENSYQPEDLISFQWKAPAR